MAGFNSDFVVTAPHVLDERVTADHYRRGRARSLTAHRVKQRLQSPVITLDPVVRILHSVMERVGDKVIDHTQPDPW